jgi:hypothetical protein
MANMIFNEEEREKRKRKEKKRMVGSKPSFKTSHASLYVEEGTIELQTSWWKLVLFHRATAHMPLK